jgi:hypothetical protein
LLPSNWAAAFEGPKTPQLGFLKGIDDAVRQRRFRADDGQVDVLGAGELDQPLPVAGRDVHVLGIQRRPRVAGRDEDAPDPPALCDNFQANACSRPPLPITSTFIRGIPSKQFSPTTTIAGATGAEITSRFPYDRLGRGFPAPAELAR